MSNLFIKDYYRKVQRLKDFGGSKNEKAIRGAFSDLINRYAQTRNLVLVPEIAFKTQNGKVVEPDGTLKDILRQDWGYWESKDQYDDLDEEIDLKLSKGYPSENIIFEDSITAVLIQGGIERQRAEISNTAALNELLEAFVSFERPEVQHFREAIDKFKEDIPAVTATLRDLLIEQGKQNQKFIEARSRFLQICKVSVDTNISDDDVREMVIQHLLTEDIFNTVFDEVQFHQENNIAKELKVLCDTFFKRDLKRQTLNLIGHYYKAIKAAAARIVDHHEKQKFLKVIYEAFYRSYNPKAADRLGVVYTPSEIVTFMIEGSECLLEKHFNKFIENENVHILDPAVGTGTFLCDLIDYLPRDILERKYKSEIHSNEVAILPYYIANLNIEYTYSQKMKSYQEFVNHCFVDTLDNLGFKYKGKQQSLLGGISEENSERIKRQNSESISLIIGNPPYYANQVSENDNNKSRMYPEVDKRIKDTFVKKSCAQKTKVYDMYARFFRWAMDRIEGNGIVAYITNRSFIDKKTFDGFRKSIQDEFDYAYVIDLKGDVRANPKISGTAHNVFGIQTGVAITFLVKYAERRNEQCQIFYHSIDDGWTRKERLDWLSDKFLEDVPFVRVSPDTNNNWIGTTDDGFSEFIPLCDKGVKAGESECAIFRRFTNGVASNRDEWVYDFDEENLKKKMKFFIESFNKCIPKQKYDDEIKWSETLKAELKKRVPASYSAKRVVPIQFRPFVVKHYYSDMRLSDRLTENHFDMYGDDLDKPNLTISFLSKDSAHPLACLATNQLVDLGFLKQGNGGTQCVSFKVRSKNGKMVDNITNWAQAQFWLRYKSEEISKLDIFYYVYAVLNNPNYKEKYRQSLGRQLPRIPFYKNFSAWRNFGKLLVDLHVKFDAAPSLKLKIVEKETKRLKPLLTVNREQGKIFIDTRTHIEGIPPLAWEYLIAGRSAIEWTLDQYSEKKLRSKVLTEKFSTFRVANHKEELIRLLEKVCSVSVSTRDIQLKMQDEDAESVRVSSLTSSSRQVK